MTLAEIGLAGQRVDMVLSGDVDLSGRLLSVAEIQQALRGLRAWEPAGAAGSGANVAVGPLGVERHARASAGTSSVGGDTAERVLGGAADTAARLRSGGDTAAGPVPGDGGSAAGGVADGGCGFGDVHHNWITVVAAHPGAGASTVALAISDAAAADGRRAHLVDPASPLRSGLVAAASAELGIDRSGAWRRGTRQLVTIDRRCGDVAPDGWPSPPSGDGMTLTVIDVGLPDPANLERLAAAGSRTVLVCRPTVPGARLADALLGSLGDGPVAVAAVGGGRWPGEVTASLGGGLRGLRSAGRVITVPIDRRLQVTGPTYCRLPRPVLAAGSRLLELLDDIDRPMQSAATGRGPVLAGRKR